MAELTIKYADGRLKTRDALYDEAKDELIEALEDLRWDTALELSNRYRENNGYNHLNVMEEDILNDMLEGETPWNIINLEVDTSVRYFAYDGYDFYGTDDVWDDVDIESFADDILDELYGCLPDAIQDIVEEYTEAVEALNSVGNTRREVINLVAKFTNCKADQYDLLAMLDKLAHSEGIFAEE